MVGLCVLRRPLDLPDFMNPELKLGEAFRARGLL